MIFNKDLNITKGSALGKKLSFLPRMSAVTLQIALCFHYAGEWEAGFLKKPWISLRIVVVVANSPHSLLFNSKYFFHVALQSVCPDSVCSSRVGEDGMEVGQGNLWPGALAGAAQAPFQGSGRETGDRLGRRPESARRSCYQQLELTRLTHAVCFVSARKLARFRKSGASI